MKNKISSGFLVVLAWGWFIFGLLSYVRHGSVVQKPGYVEGTPAILLLAFYFVSAALFTYWATGMRIALLVISGALLLFSASFLGFASAIDSLVYKKILWLSLCLNFLALGAFAIVVKIDKGFFRVASLMAILYGLSIAPQAIQRLNYIYSMEPKAGPSPSPASN